MSRFDQEFALVPTGARWTAVLVALAFAALMAGIFLVPVAANEPKALVFVLPVFLASLMGAVALGTFVLLVGYVFGDAKRRGMNHVLWTLLADLHPERDRGHPVLHPARARSPSLPRCGAMARKGHAYCAGCGTAVRVACPQCRQPVEPGWRNCARCGAALAARPEGASTP